MLMMQSVTLLRVVVEIKERLWQKSDF